MKKLKKIPSKLWYVIIAFASFAIISSCEKPSQLESEIFESDGTSVFTSGSFSQVKNFNDQDICGEVQVIDFLAGQHFLAGSILISNSEEKLYVTFTTTNGWVIGQTHLYVGDLSGVPVNKKGNPQIGHFPYADSFSPFVTSFTYEFDLVEFDECFIVAAHAEVYLLDENGNVIQAETAWSKGTPFNSSGSWAMYSDYCKQACNECEYEIISTELFGGQTILVGSLEVTNDEEFLYVTYITTNDWYLNETHLYVGPFDELPTNNSNTPVPGHFPYSEDHVGLVNTYTYTIPLEGLPDCYIIAAHASVYKIVNGEVVQSETAWGFGTPFPNTNRWGWYMDYCTQVCL